MSSGDQSETSITKNGEAIENGKTYSKWKSRTFWLAIVWLALIPLSVVYNLLQKANVTIDIKDVILWAGIVSGAFVTGNKVFDVFKVIKGE